MAEEFYERIYYAKYDFYKELRLKLLFTLNATFI